MCPKKETREKILSAALELFSKNGYEATSTKSIAERSGVNEVTVFRHFDNKKNLLQACVEEKLDVEEDLMDVDLEPSGDIEKDLTTIGLEMGGNMIERSNLIKVMLMETENHPGVFRNMSHIPFKVLEFLIEYFERAKEKSLLKDINAEMAAITFYSFFFRIMVVNAFLNHDPFMDFDKDSVENFVKIFVNGLEKNE